MLWVDLNREIASILSGNSALADERPLIFVDSAAQRLHWVDVSANDSRIYPVSTASAGIGNQLNSYQTPSGVHRVQQKIGGGEDSGTIFEARRPIGKIACNLDNRAKDEITSRILWLGGLEDGVNQGGECDTFARYIYIHGTSDEKRIGKPVSAGCVRMLNDDVIELFDKVMVGDIVLIR